MTDSLAWNELPVLTPAALNIEEPLNKFWFNPLKKQIKYLLVTSVALVPRLPLLVPTPAAINFDFDAPILKK